MFELLERQIANTCEPALICSRPEVTSSRRRPAKVLSAPAASSARVPDSGVVSTSSRSPKFWTSLFVHLDLQSRPQSCTEEGSLWQAIFARKSFFSFFSSKTYLPTSNAKVHQNCGWSLLEGASVVRHRSMDEILLLESDWDPKKRRAFCNRSETSRLRKCRQWKFSNAA